MVKLFGAIVEDRQSEGEPNEWNNNNNNDSDIDDDNDDVAVAVVCLT